MRFSRLALPIIGALVLAAPAVQASATADKALVEAVRARLNTTDPEVGRTIEIDAKDGVVTLKGITLSPGQLIKALQETQTVHGVLKVVNRLTLR